METDAFDTLMSSLDPPMIVVTAAAGVERGGWLVGFHAQSSIDPPQYSLWLSKANRTYRLALEATHVGLHLLADEQLGLAERFGAVTGDDVDKLAGLALDHRHTEAPLLTDVPHRILARRVALVDEGGDHVCLTTEPTHAESGGPFRPLRLSAVVHLDPGHHSDERRA